MKRWNEAQDKKADMYEYVYGYAYAAQWEL